MKPTLYIGVSDPYVVDYQSDYYFKVGGVSWDKPPIAKPSEDRQFLHLPDPGTVTLIATPAADMRKPLLERSMAAPMNFIVERVLTDGRRETVSFRGEVMRWADLQPDANPPDVELKVKISGCVDFSEDADGHVNVIGALQIESVDLLIRLNTAGEMINELAGESGYTIADESRDAIKRLLDAVEQRDVALKQIHWIMGRENVPPEIRDEVCKLIDQTLPTKEAKQ